MSWFGELADNFWGGAANGAVSSATGGNVPPASSGSGSSFNWSPFITAGLQTVGGLVSGLIKNDLATEAQEKAEAFEREKWEWQKQQAELNRQSAGAARRLQAQMAAIEARIKAAQLDQSPAGYSRMAERVQAGATIDQNALNTIIAGFQNWSK